MLGGMGSGIEGTPEPRWLDEDQQRAWTSLMGIVLRLPGALDAQLQRDIGISSFEYSVLSRLSMAAERTMRMSRLAALAEGSLSRLSQVVARLEKRGWIRRTPDPADGRYTLAILTDTGWDTVVAAAPGHVAEVRRLVFDPLTKAQQRQLLEIGQRIMCAIAADDRRLDSDAGQPR
jgi:DNA-binding MarR family transcriptional regulator